MKEKKPPKGYIKVGNDYPNIEDGAPVIMNHNYVREGESPRKYFVMEASKGIALIADNKRMLNNGEGYLYSIWSIDYYKEV